MTAGSIEGPGAGYSLQDAAVLLGVSVNTLRQRIRAGQVQAERVQRPQGYVWQVYVETLQPPDSPGSDPPIQEAPSRLQQPQQLAQADALATLIQATLTPIIAPLVGELAASRQALERQAGELRELEREVGRVSALLDSARAQIRTLTAPTASQSVEPATEPSVLFLRRRWLWVAVLIAFVVLTTWLLAWPR
jgi:hypothetical protein